MPTMIFTSEPKDYTSFLSEFIERLTGYDVKGIALVALTSEDNLTAYWNMSLRDKAMAESEIRYDTIDQFIEVNKDRYFESEEYE